MKRYSVATRGTIFAMWAMVISLSSVVLAQGVFPYPPPEGHVRVVTWNIEFLGARDPLRTQEQLDDLAERMVGFDADIFALQEIISEETLAYVANQMGPEWTICNYGEEHPLLYNAQKVELLDSEYWLELGLETYPTYPGPSYRAPIYGRFRQVGTDNVGFDVVGVHFHWINPGIRTEEGEAVKMKIDELLVSQNGNGDVILGGDLNCAPGTDAHPPLQSGGELELLAKANGNGTGFSGYPIDHFYVTAGMTSRVSNGTAFVIRPEHYGESREEFEATYSDHWPVLIDFMPDNDFDDDGLTDGDEQRDLDPGTEGVQNPFDPLVADSTGDNGQDTPDGKPDGQNDYDGDGMTNREEFTFGYDPLDPNSWAELPLAAWPVALAVLSAGLLIWRKRRRSL